MVKHWYYIQLYQKNVRVGVLVLIFVNICLFFTDHALTAAHVDIHGQVLGDKYYEKEAFPFGLGYSLVNLWNACAVVLVGFMATFSGKYNSICVTMLILISRIANET